MNSSSVARNSSRRRIGRTDGNDVANIRGTSGMTTATDPALDRATGSSRDVARTGTGGARRPTFGPRLLDAVGVPPNAACHPAG
jgi:hypothetical protein